MLTESMKIRSVERQLAALVGLFLLVASCEKVSLVAPSGSSITLTAQATALPANGTTDIIALVLEAAGTPPHSGTVITFSTTLGSIEPDQARTDTSGRVIVKFRAGTNNGTALINATSGGATTIRTDGSGAVRIAVGTAAVARVSVSAAPNPVPAIGGTSTITASVADINGNLLPSAPVFFTTTAGSLADSLVNTGPDGSARTSLTTNVQATVTATVGVQGATGATGGTGNTSGTAAGTVQVNVSVAPGLAITPPTTPPNVGLPANFTFVVTPATTNGSAVRNVHVDWGDGSSRDLGAITGSSVQSHVYQDDGTFTVTATVTDAMGNSQTVSTSVTVIPVASPTIIITPNVPQQSSPVVRVTFTIQVTPPTGVIITNAVIDFGDNTAQSLGGLTGTTTVPHDYTRKGATVVTVIVTDSIGRNTTAQVTINIP
jgi:Big-like domain-containing protein/PKD domain-containing protein